LVSSSPAATVTVGGQPLVLLPEKAAWLESAQALLIADAHIGKAASFRRLGVPVPQGTTSDTLARLDELIGRWTPRRIVFLGDLLHSPAAFADATSAAFATWRARHASLELVLVRGNHDARAGAPPAAFGVRVVAEPWQAGGFALCHHPRPRSEGYVLAGHLHPCVTLRGRGAERLRLPCFHFGAAVGVLPAFGAFTGMHPIEPAPGDRVFAAADGQVLEVPLAG
jgi:DNA ligase-associated metallophosphoesterase